MVFTLLKNALLGVNIAQFKGTTTDGSTTIIEALDSSDAVVMKVDTQGFGRSEYRDEYVAGPWLTPQGATAPDEVTVTIGGIDYRVYAFDGGSTQETLTNSFEMQHDLDFVGLNAGTVKAEWHVHWMPSTADAGDVKWFFDWAYLPADGSAAISMTALTCIDSCSSQQTRHLICGTELAKPSSGFNVGDIILFRLRRTPNDGADTYGADALLIKTALHVPVNSKGSRQRYIK
jgi:hypothetical protein